MLNHKKDKSSTTNAVVAKLTQAHKNHNLCTFHFFLTVFFFWPSSILRISSSKRFYSNSKYLFKIVSDGLVLKKEKEGTWTKASPKVKSNSIRTVRKGKNNQKLSRRHNHRVNFKSSTLSSKIHETIKCSRISKIFQSPIERSRWPSPCILMIVYNWFILG